MPNANCTTLYHSSLFNCSHCFDETFKSAADYLFLLKNRALIKCVHTTSILGVMKSGGISNTVSLSLGESLRAKLLVYPKKFHVFFRVLFRFSQIKSFFSAALRRF